MELEAQKATQLAQHEAKKQHWAKEEESRRKYEENILRYQKRSERKETLEIDFI